MIYSLIFRSARFFVFLFAFLWCNTHLLAQQDSVVTVPNVPTTGQKLMFYGLTAVGGLLLFLSYKQSKWGKKK